MAIDYYVKVEFAFTSTTTGRYTITFKSNNTTDIFINIFLYPPADGITYKFVYNGVEYASSQTKLAPEGGYVYS